MYLGLNASEGVNKANFECYAWVSGAAGFTFSLHSAISKSPFVDFGDALFLVMNL